MLSGRFLDRRDCRGDVVVPICSVVLDMAAPVRNLQEDSDSNDEDHREPRSF